MSREGGQEKQWHDAHNYVRRTIASVTPLRASMMARVRARRGRRRVCCRIVALSVLASGQGEGWWALVIVLSSGEGDGVSSESCRHCVVAGQEGEGASALLSGRGRWRWRGYVVSVVVIREREWERVTSSSERERVSTSLSIVGEKAGMRVSHRRCWGEGDGEGASSSSERG